MHSRHDGPSASWPWTGVPVFIARYVFHQFAECKREWDLRVRVTTCLERH
jgi:hypothetical protein